MNERGDTLPGFGESKTRLDEVPGCYREVHPVDGKCSRQLRPRRRLDPERGRELSRVARRGALLRTLCPLVPRLVRAELPVDGRRQRVIERSGSQQRVRASGFPKSMRAILRKLGATAPDIAQLQQTFVKSQPPRRLQVFPAMFDDPGLAYAEADDAKALAAYARLLK